MRDFRCIVILTCTSCQLRCKYCVAHQWMDKNVGFQTSLDQVKRMIDCSIASHYHFQYVNLAGGEPLLWKNLIPALIMLNESHIADEISINTNLMWFDETKITEMKIIASLIDIIVISKYPPINDKKCELFLDNHIVGRNGGVEVITVPFTKKPQKPIEETIPAICGCVAMGLYGDTVDACVGMRFIADDLKLEMSSKFTTKLDVGYAEKLDLENLYNSDMCKLCVSNKNVIDLFTSKSWEAEG